MTRIETCDDVRVGRRTFLLANLALVTSVSAQSPPLQTFTQWVDASRRTRDAALEPCIDLIRSLDGEIKAWVQVLPQ